MSKIALVLGGTHDHISLIKILKAEGYFTYLIDYFSNPPAKEYADKHIQESTLDKDRVCQLANNLKADLVIAVCIDQALHTMAYVSEKLELPCHISYQKAQNVTNKAYMKAIFLRHDIPTARFQVVVPGFDDIGCFNKWNFPLVVKPADSNSSKGVQKVLNFNALTHCIKNAMSLSRTKTVIIEEFIEGEELSVDAVVKDGIAEVVMITQNIKSIDNTDHFTITQSIYDIEFEQKYVEQTKEIVQAISASFEIHQGPLLVQMLAKEDKLFVIEFSARIGGGSKLHLINCVKNFDVVHFFVLSILGKSQTIKKSFNPIVNLAAIQYLYTKNGVVTNFKGFDELKKTEHIVEFFFYKSLGMSVSNSIASSDRSAGILIVGKDKNELLDKISFAKANIAVLDKSNENILI